ncbi:hypothetical protein [Bradyrhizobium sp. CCBAU 11445]|uniref:hypothetical protein n=1 Tax=Bradyrhizobium sp. CCBAU 11445 TaxID=1630896 RepID=UPI0023057D87|nr:hypothetical protein [Bradyrhizobium sp. CCBAU 11445]
MIALDAVQTLSPKDDRKRGMLSKSASRRELRCVQWMKRTHRLANRSDHERQCWPNDPVAQAAALGIHRRELRIKRDRLMNVGARWTAGRSDVAPRKENGNSGLSKARFRHPQRMQKSLIKSYMAKGMRCEG